MKTRVTEELSEHIANSGVLVCHVCAAKVNPDQSSSDQRGPTAITYCPYEMIW